MRLARALNEIEAQQFAFLLLVNFAFWPKRDCARMRPKQNHTKQTKTLNVSLVCKTTQREEKEASLAKKLIQQT